MEEANFVFDLSNTIVLPFWILLILFPRSGLTRTVFAHPKFSPMHILAIIYAAMVIPALFSAPEIISSLAKPTLAGVQAMLSSPMGAAAGWIHYLCFDLFVGAFVWKKAMERGQHFRWVSIALVFVLMFGPVGWLMYEVGSLLNRDQQNLTHPA
jgi:hypothetical protein